jgi:hypothetical protein
MSKTYLSGRAAALSPERHFIARSAFILLLWLWGGGALFAQENGVKVSNLVVDAGTVTFDVSWASTDMPDVWVDSAWVFVDYNKNGVMTRLPLSSGATLTATSAEGVGKVIEVENNNQGVWIVGNARTESSFSATVQLFTDEPNVAGVCVYASNYPPVGNYTSAKDISFTGTPQYTIVMKKDAEEATETRTSSSPFTVLEGFTVQSFTDKTGAPGLINCLAPGSPTVVDATFCYGLLGQLQAVAPEGATIVWYDAITAGNVLYAGNVLPLTLLNEEGQYFAEAVSEVNCPSTRTKASYEVSHCVLNGYCPGFEAGTLGSASSSELSCGEFDSGRIGLVNYNETCEAFYPGRIGSEVAPIACVSFDAGHIGK